jgi:hypothetical protein
MTGISCPSRMAHVLVGLTVQRERKGLQPSDGKIKGLQPSDGKIKAARCGAVGWRNNADRAGIQREVRRRTLASQSAQLLGHTQ